MSRPAHRRPTALAASALVLSLALGACARQVDAPPTPSASGTPITVVHGGEGLDAAVAAVLARHLRLHGHAVADDPTGSFVKDEEPVLVSNDVAAGPGHNSLIEVGGQVWMVYHAWVPGAVGDEVTGRQMWLSRVDFTGDGGVEVEQPTAQHPVAPEAGE